MFLLQDGHYYLAVMRQEAEQIRALCELAERDLQAPVPEEGRSRFLLVTILIGHNSYRSQFLIDT